MKQLVIPSIFTAVDKFTAPMERMTKAVGKFSAESEAKLNRIGAAARNVATKSLIIGTAIAAPLIFATAKAADYETGLASLSAITGVTGAKFDEFRAKVEDVSRETRRGPIEVAKAFELAGSAMPELLNSADALSRVSKASIVLSKASGEELEPSIRSLTGVMNQFTLGADQSERTINVLAAGAKVGAASIAQTSEAMVNFGATAKGANLSVEQATAAIQVMSKFGLFGAEAGTKLRGSLLRLQQTGVGYKSGQFQVNDALAETFDKMQKLRTAKQKDAFLNKVFGAENISTGRILLNNIGLFKEYTAGVTATSEATIQAAIRQKTFSEKMNAVKAQTELLSIKIGESLLPVINTLLDKLIPIIDKTVEWAKANPELVKTLTKIAVGAAAFFLITSAIAGIISWVTSLIGLFGTIIKVMGIFGGLWSNYILVALQVVWATLTAIVEIIAGALGASVGVVVGAIALLVSLVMSFYRNWEMITSAFKNGGIIAGLKAIGATILDAILYPLQKVLEIIAKLPVVGKYAAAGAEGIQNMRAGMGIQVDAVNPKAAEQEGMVNRTENTNNASVDINVNDPNKRTTATSSSPGVKINLGSTMAFGG